MLLLADGSQHRWLEDRGPAFTLIAAIDDATGKPWGGFFEQESAEGYFSLLRHISLNFGIPHAWYTDRASVFVDSRTYIDPVLDPPQPTQFARALGQLGVELILANSPQAKGRIERFFDTAQDRLVSFLRMHDVRTMRHANLVLPTYLGEHIRRFGVPPRDPDPAWLPWPSHLEPNNVFCLHHKRKLSRDHTISIHGRRVDVPAPNHHMPAGAWITVLEDFAGTLRLAHRGVDLGVVPDPPTPPPKPAPNHPWRQHR
jgi:hypothetical protein